MFCFKQYSRNGNIILYNTEEMNFIIYKKIKIMYNKFPYFYKISHN